MDVINISDVRSRALSGKVADFSGSEARQTKKLEHFSVSPKR
jgi:hypothetical protein